MRTEIINLIKCLTTKGQPGLDDHLVELVERYEKMKAMSEGISSEITAEDKDIMFAEEILNIFYSGKELGSQEVVLGEEKEKKIKCEVKGISSVSFLRTVKEPNLIPFHKAAPLMKVGDVFKTDLQHWNNLELYIEDGVPYFKSRKIKKITLAPVHFNLMGEIISVDPKVLKFQEWIEQEDYYKPLEKNEYSLEDMKISFEAGDQNGRLERDLEVKPVIEKVKRYMGDHGCNDFSMVMNHLKPLNPNE